MIKKLEEAIRVAVASPQFEEAGLKIGFLPAFLPADEFGNRNLHRRQQACIADGSLGLKKR